MRWSVEGVVFAFGWALTAVIFNLEIYKRFKDECKKTGANPRGLHFIIMQAILSLALIFTPALILQGLRAFFALG